MPNGSERVARVLQLVRLRVLAFRVRPAGSRESCAQTAIEFPPMQKGASFNLEAVKAQIEKAHAAHAGQ